MAPDVAKDAAGAGTATGGAFGVADVMEGNGLDRAREMAGSVLDGIFGFMPWEMSGGEVADAAGQAAVIAVDSGVLA